MIEQSGDMTSAFESALSAHSEGEAAPASPPTPEPTPSAEPSAATTAPSEPTPEPAPVATSEKPKGEPPAWRWQDILANTRETVAKETAERVKQEVEQQYAGLKDFAGLDPDERAGLVVWNRALRGDPSALAQVAQVNPQLAAAIQGKTVSAPDPEPQPDAAIQLADGSTVPVFTPEGMAKREAWLQKHLESTLEARLSEKFQPALSVAGQLQQMEQIRQQEAQTQQWATQVLAPLKRLPYFEEFKPAIGKALADLPETFAGNLEEVVFDTYAALHQAKLAQLTQEAEPKAMATLQQRAVAGSPNPGAPSASTPGTFKPGVEGFEAALAHFSGTR